jgi:hypothetical protein
VARASVAAESRASGCSVPVIPQLRAILELYRATVEDSGAIFLESLDPSVVARSGPQ